ncbi:MAG: hypothetical protein AAF208_11165 [Cyanobacteria bacterium P01_A01_bin.45]
MTFLGWTVGGIASLALEKTFVELLPAIAPEYQQNWLIWSKYITPGVFALIFGADQGLVVYKYISGWWWVSATTFGWLISNYVSSVWIEYISNFAISASQGLSASDRLIFAIMTTVAYIFSGVWLGLFQWLVLRRYAIKSWKWIFVPSCSFLSISVCLIIFTQFQYFFPTLSQPKFKYLGEQILTALMLGVIPSIALCTFRIKPSLVEHT